MGIQISNREFDAMDGLPHFHRCLYIFGIRKHMDFTTGITGIKREISYKSLAEENYVEPHQGVEESGEKSRDQVKRALALLEKKGLISRHSVVTKDEKQLIIKCLLADRDESVQNKPAPYPPWAGNAEAALEAAPLTGRKNPIKTDSSGMGLSESRPETHQGGLAAKNEKAAPHPISVDLIRLDLRGAILNLLEMRQFTVAHLVHNKTVAMLKVLEENKFSVEEIEAAMLHADAQLGTRPKVPWYYLDSILQKRAELTYAREKANRKLDEVNHETDRPRTAQNVYRRNQQSNPRAAALQKLEERKLRKQKEREEGTR